MTPTMEQTTLSKVCSVAIQDILGPEPGDVPTGDDAIEGVDLAKHVAELYERKEELDFELKQLNERIAKAGERVIAWMTENAMPRGTWSKTTLYLSTKVFAKARPEAIKDGSLARAIRRLGGDPADFIAKGVNGNTLSAWVRNVAADIKDSNEEAALKKVADILPPGLVKAIELREVPALGHRKAPR